jgi:hypothetical protein
MKEFSGASAQVTLRHAAVLHDAAFMDLGAAVSHEGVGVVALGTPGHPLETVTTDPTSSVVALGSPGHPAETFTTSHISGVAAPPRMVILPKPPPPAPLQGLPSPPRLDILPRPPPQNPLPLLPCLAHLAMLTRLSVLLMRRLTKSGPGASSTGLSGLSPG